MSKRKAQLEAAPLAPRYKRPAFARKKLRRGPPMQVSMFGTGQTHRFRQFVDGAQNPDLGLRYIQQIGAAQSIGFAFRLSDIPQYVSFTSIFDQYRITAVKVEFIPMTNSSIASGTVATGPVGNAGLIATVVDYDDVTSGLTFLQLAEYDTFQYTPTISSRNHTRYLEPRIAQAAFGLGVFTSYSIGKARQWIDAASPSVSHYGCKVYIDPYGLATAGQTWQIMMHYDVEFKHVR